MTLSWYVLNDFSYLIGHIGFIISLNELRYNFIWTNNRIII
nr:MAG TPA: hypothetical protein [Caudoviricetes sp.]